MGRSDQFEAGEEQDFESIDASKGLVLNLKRRCILAAVVIR